jgi:hypothetical protein
VACAGDLVDVTAYQQAQGQELKEYPSAGLFHDREEFTTPWSIKVFAIMIRA